MRPARLQMCAQHSAPVQSSSFSLRVVFVRLFPIIKGWTLNVRVGETAQGRRGAPSLPPLRRPCLPCAGSGLALPPRGEPSFAGKNPIYLGSSGTSSNQIILPPLWLVLLVWPQAEFSSLYLRPASSNSSRPWRFRISMCNLIRLKKNPMFVFP